MQKAFSQSSACFGHVPNDSELTSLLGDADCGPIKGVEDGKSLTVRPWLIPMKYMAPWAVLTMVVITVMTAFLYGKFDLLAWLFLAFGWFVCLPGFLGITVLINWAFAKKGNYIKVDVSRRTLELCRLGRTFTSDQIAAIIELSRWYLLAGGWEHTLQTSVLIRKPDGQFELFPMLREIQTPRLFGKPQWADRLAAILQTSVRRVKLSRSESRQLNDC